MELADRARKGFADGVAVVELAALSNASSIAPGLRIIATSREPLGLTGERMYLLSPMGIPAESDLDSPDAIGNFAAVRLLDVGDEEVDGRISLVLGEADLPDELGQGPD